MPTSIVVWDGAGVIGGNKILLQADGTSIFLDFGTCFATRGRYYEEFLNPRGVRGLLDPLEMGLLPPIHGIYRPDMEPPEFNVWDRVEPAQTVNLQGVLLSHAHVDHNGYLSFLRRDIPVLSSAMTAVLCKAMQDCGRAPFEHETCYLVPKEAKEGLLESVDYRRGPAQQRQFLVVGESVSTPVADFWNVTYGSRALEASTLVVADRIGGMPVRRFDVDHSIFGASAFAVETSVGWIVYTGDLRCHGANAAKTQEFAEIVRQLRPALLICEGTHVDKSECATEDAVHSNALSRAQAAEGRFVVADFGPRNIERLLSFLDVARETGRRLVITAKDAFLLTAMRTASAGVPDLSEEDSMSVLSEPKARVDKWESEFVRQRYSDRLVRTVDLHARQGDFILCYSFFDVNDLVDIDPDPGGVWIYSSSEAYSEEQAIDLGRLRSWLGHFDMVMAGDPDSQDENAPLHASGHISGPELLALIRTIAPRAVMPVHTEQPGFFQDNLSGEMKVIRPERGTPITIT